MANPEHVEILKVGVDSWNQWRLENPDVRPNLCGVDLRKDNIKKTGLEAKGVEGAEIRNINFSNTDLTSARLDNCDSIFADFKEANLHGVNFDGASLHRANFTKAFCRFAVFKNCNLSGADFSGADVYGVKFAKSSRQKNFRGINVATCYGSQRFKTFAQDQDFIEELRASGKWGAFLFWIWWIFADCGRSFLRWAVWALIFALVFAVIFTPYPSWAPDWYVSLCKYFGPSFHQTPPSFEGQPMSFWSALYFSIVTFTTLGFGDVVANNTAARILVGVEVVLGYIMLGGLISILANKLARRS